MSFRKSRNQNSNDPSKLSKSLLFLLIIRLGLSLLSDIESISTVYHGNFSEYSQDMAKIFGSSFIITDFGDYIILIISIIIIIFQMNRNEHRLSGGFVILVGAFDFIGSIVMMNASQIPVSEYFAVSPTLWIPFLIDIVLIIYGIKLLSLNASVSTYHSITSKSKSNYTGNITWSSPNTSPVNPTFVNASNSSSTITSNAPQSNIPQNNLGSGPLLICRNCNTENPLTSVFCSNCGNRLRS